MAIQRSSKDEFGIGHDFANAVLYGLSDHPLRAFDVRGSVIPINETVWKQVLEHVFPDEYDGKPPQTLAAYCSYFRLGKHGIGYDQRGQRDFARGKRTKLKDRGKQGLDVTNDPERAIWPRNSGSMEASEVIRVAMDYMKSHHPNWSEARKRLVHIADDKSDQYAEFGEILDDPVRREMVTEAFERKATWARAARKLYGYKCMISGCQFELIKENGELYIEVHHIKAMYDGGSPNDKKNLSVVCPNHHREIHYATARRRKELTALLKREQTRRLMTADD